MLIPTEKCLHWLAPDIEVIDENNFNKLTYDMSSMMLALKVVKELSI